MNILILSVYGPTSTMFGEGMGGSQEVMYQLGKRWVKMGNNVKIISAYKDKKIPKMENLDGIEVRRVGKFYNAILSIKDAYKEEEKWADIVLENHTSFPLFTPLYVKKPTISIMHHLMNEDYIGTAGIFKGIIGICMEKCVPIFYKNTTFVSVSEFTKTQLVKSGIRKTNVNVIPNGVDNIYFTPGLKETHPLILFLGNFADGRKRINDLIKAFNIVSSKIPSAELIIAGKGDNKEDMIKEVCRNDDRVKFLGVVNIETKRELYQRSWVFVNPSIKEGFSLSCLEANSCGTPAIIYHIEGLDTVIHNINGLVIECDIRKLADSIIMLLNNHVLRQELSMKSSKFVVKFGWGDAADEYVTMFKSLI